MRRTKLSTRVARATERLDRVPLLLGIVVLAAAAFVTYVSVIAINGVPFQGRYPVRAVVPAGAPLLKDGDEVRVDGQRAGQVRSVELDPGGALVKMELTDGVVGEGARATVRLRGLAGLTYVDLERGDTSRPLPPGSTIPRSRTASGVELTDVVDAFDPPTRRGLGRSLSGYGVGLTGRGDDLNDALGDLEPALRRGRPLIDAFTPAPGEFSGMLAEARRAASAAAPPGSRELEALVPAAAATFGSVSERGRELGAALGALRPFEDEALAVLPEADPLLRDLATTADVLDPGIRELARATPDLNGLLARDQRLAQLTRLARGANPVLRPAQPLMRELRPAAASLAPFARPLGSLASAILPYDEEIVGGPAGFGEWGRFFYPGTGEAEDGLAHRAVRFGVVLTCHFGRNLYPDPGTVRDQKEPCF